jgi:hypothetical protein
MLHIQLKISSKLLIPYKIALEVVGFNKLSREITHGEGTVESNIFYTLFT